MDATVDWKAVRAEFETDLKSLRDIGQMYGVSHTAIRKRAAKEGWGRKVETIDLVVDTERLEAQKTLNEAEEVFMRLSVKRNAISKTQRAMEGRIIALKHELATAIIDAFVGTQEPSKYPFEKFDALATEHAVTEARLGYFPAALAILEGQAKQAQAVLLKAQQQISLVEKDRAYIKLRDEIVVNPRILNCLEERVLRSTGELIGFRDEIDDLMRALKDYRYRQGIGFKAAVFEWKPFAARINKTDDSTGLSKRSVLV